MQTRRFYAYALVGLCTLIASCARAAINVHSAQSPQARFDTYRTFELRTAEKAPPFYAVSAQSAEACRRIVAQTRELLVAKGYLEANGERPDLIFLVAAGRRERAIRSEEPPHAPWLAENEEEDFIEGAFVIDAFDGKNDELVWHGSARAEVDLHAIDNNRLRAAVNAVIARFPARVATH